MTLCLHILRTHYILRLASSSAHASFKPGAEPQCDIRALALNTPPGATGPRPASILSWELEWTLMKLLDTIRAAGLWTSVKPEVLSTGRGMRGLFS
jgi:hypothetical protein